MIKSHKKEVIIIENFAILLVLLCSLESLKNHLIGVLIVHGLKLALVLFGFAQRWSI